MCSSDVCLLKADIFKPMHESLSLKQSLKYMLASSMP